MIVHDVLEINDDGSITLACGPARSANSLISIFPQKMKKEIEAKLRDMEIKYRIAQEDARKLLLYEFGQHFPALKKECEKHCSK